MEAPAVGFRDSKPLSSAVAPLIYILIDILNRLYKGVDYNIYIGIILYG
jgi:hypothetical protein